MAVIITSAAQSDIGHVRKINQDTFGVDSDLQLYIVCDGMGGAAGGEIASSLAVDAFLESFRSAAHQTTYDHALLQAATAANKTVLARADSQPNLHGMGTTLVAAYVEAEHLHLINIGDSRAYLIRGGECTQLTVDHSYLQEQVRLGLMTRAAANASPLQSVITKAVGIREGFEPDLFTVEMSDGDFVLLTSDGLTRHVSDTSIARIVNGKGPVRTDSLNIRCRELIESAKQRGGSDNITCILLHVSIS